MFLRFSEYDCIDSLVSEMSFLENVQRGAWGVLGDEQGCPESSGGGQVQTEVRAGKLQDSELGGELSPAA